MRNTIDGDLIKDSLRKKYSNYLLKCIQYLGEFGCDFSKTTKSRYPKHAQLNLALELALRYNDYQCVSTIVKSCKKYYHRRKLATTLFNNILDNINTDEQDIDEDDDSESDEKHQLLSLSRNISFGISHDSDDSTEQQSIGAAITMTTNDKHQKRSLIVKSGQQMLKSMLNLNQQRIVAKAIEEEKLSICKIFLQCVDLQVSNRLFDAIISNTTFTKNDKGVVTMNEKRAQFVAVLNKVLLHKRSNLLQRIAVSGNVDELYIHCRKMYNSLYESRQGHVNIMDKFNQLLKHFDSMICIICNYLQIQPTHMAVTIGELEAQARIAENVRVDQESQRFDIKIGEILPVVQETDETPEADEADKTQKAEEAAKTEHSKISKTLKKSPKKKSKKPNFEYQFRTMAIDSKYMRIIGGTYGKIVGYEYNIIIDVANHDNNDDDSNIIINMNESSSLSDDTSKQVSENKDDEQYIDKQVATTTTTARVSAVMSKMFTFSILEVVPTLHASLKRMTNIFKANKLSQRKISFSQQFTVQDVPGSWMCAFDEGGRFIVFRKDYQLWVFVNDYTQNDNYDDTDENKDADVETAIGLVYQDEDRDEKAPDVEELVYKPHKTLEKHCLYVTDAKFVNKNEIVSCTADGRCILWNVNKGVSISEFTVATNKINCIAFHKYDPDNSNREILFAAGSTDGNLYFFNYKQFDTCAANFRIGESSVNSIQFSPNGAQIIVSSSDSYVRIYEIDCKSLLSINSTELNCNNQYVEDHKQNDRDIFNEKDLFAFDEIKQQDRGLVNQQQLQLRKMKQLALMHDYDISIDETDISNGNWKFKVEKRLKLENTCISGSALKRKLEHIQKHLILYNCWMQPKLIFKSQRTITNKNSNSIVSNQAVFANQDLVFWVVEGKIDTIWYAYRLPTMVTNANLNPVQSNNACAIEWKQGQLDQWDKKKQNAKLVIDKENGLMFASSVEYGVRVYDVEALSSHLFVQSTIDQAK